MTKPHVRWTSDKLAPQKTSMLLVGEHLDTVTDDAIAACRNRDGGAEICKARLSGDFSASPLYADGHVYFFGHNGTATVFSHGRVVNEVARNSLDGGFLASPL